MNQFEMVVMIVGIVMLASVARRYYGAKAQAGAGLGRDELTAILNRLDKMEARLQVLERLATDKSQRLADEIDALKKP